MSSGILHLAAGFLRQSLGPASSPSAPPVDPRTPGGAPVGGSVFSQTLGPAVSIPRPVLHEPMTAEDRAKCLSLLRPGGPKEVEFRTRVLLRYQRGRGYSLVTAVSCAVRTTQWLRHQQAISFRGEKPFVFEDPSPTVFRGGFHYPGEMPPFYVRAFQSVSPDNSVTIRDGQEPVFSISEHSLFGPVILPMGDHGVTVITKEGRSTNLSGRDQDLQSQSATGIFLRDGDVIQIDDISPFVFKAVREPRAPLRTPYNRIYASSGAVNAQIARAVNEHGHWIPFGEGRLPCEVLFEPYSQRLLFRYRSEGPYQSDSLASAPRITLTHDETTETLGLGHPFVAVDSEDVLILQTGVQEPIMIHVPTILAEEPEGTQEPRSRLAALMAPPNIRKIERLAWAFEALGIHGFTRSRPSVEEAYRRRLHLLGEGDLFDQVRPRHGRGEVEAAYETICRALSWEPSESPS